VLNFNTTVQHVQVFIYSLGIAYQQTQTPAASGWIISSPVSTPPFFLPRLERNEGPLPDTQTRSCIPELSTRHWHGLLCVRNFRQVVPLTFVKPRTFFPLFCVGAPFLNPQLLRPHLTSSYSSLLINETTLPDKPLTGLCPLRRLSCPSSQDVGLAGPSFRSDFAQERLPIAP